MSDSESDDREVCEELLYPSTSKPERGGPSESQASSSLAGSSSHGSDAASTSSTSEGRSSNYFADLDVNLHALQNRAQSLIDKINDKRMKDQTLMKNFNTNLNIKVAELSQYLEDKMYQMYEQNNTHLQARVQQLTEILDRIGQLKAELKQVCQTLVAVYKDLGLQHDS